MAAHAATIRAGTAPSGSSTAIAELSQLDERALASVVDLERRVVDVEALVEHLLELEAHRVTVDAAGDQHVSGQRGHVRADLPDVEVVHVPHGAVSRQGFPDLGCARGRRDRKSTRLNSSHTVISYAVFCLKKKNYQPILTFAHIKNST